VHPEVDRGDAGIDVAVEPEPDVSAPSPVPEVHRREVGELSDPGACLRILVRPVSGRKLSTDLWALAYSVRHDRSLNRYRDL